MSWKLLVAILGLIPSIYAVIQIANWFNRPEPIIVGIVTSGPVVNTPEDDQFWKMIGKARAGRWLGAAQTAALSHELAGHGAPPLETPQGRVAERDLSTAVQAELKRVLPSRMTRKIFTDRGFTRVVVRNEGSEVANGVRLSIPFPEEMEVKSGDSPARWINGSVANVGSLEPFETATVTTLDPDNNPFFFGNVRLVYENGLGRVSFAEPATLSTRKPFWLYLAIFSPMALFTCWTILAQYGWRFVRVPKGHSFRLVSTASKGVPVEKAADSADVEALCPPKTERGN